MSSRNGGARDLRKIAADLIGEVSAELAQKANFALRPDVLSALRRALGSGLGNRKPNHGPLASGLGYWKPNRGLLARETDKTAREILKAIIANADMAKKERLAICQDTGMAVVFAEIGQQVCITGGLLTQAINRGIYSGYRDGCLRDSIVANPL